MSELDQYKKRGLNLNINYFYGSRDKMHFALVKNFPGLDAEMKEAELRLMASELLAAADHLAKQNK